MRLLHLLVATASIGLSYGLCVFDSKHGWYVDCGLRDSFLLRIKDYGGIFANFDVGIGFGDSHGFPQSIPESKGDYGHHPNHYKAPKAKGYTPPKVKGYTPPKAKGHTPPKAKGYTHKANHHRRSDNNNQRKIVSNEQYSNEQNIQKQQFSARTFTPQNQKIVRRRQGSSPRLGIRAPALYMVAPPPHRREDTNNIIQEIPGRGNQPTIVITHDAPSPQPTPAAPLPTIGPSFGSLLNIDSNTVADTDHVPSFAAKMFVVREAPEEFYPPGYKAPKTNSEIEQRVEVPRTKFFCEEQKFLPGIYADVQLGCKVFHLCLPAAMGNSMTSFLCPNMTLFDQSIMQCNYWYHVNCERAESHYDANLPMAISYRKINAAQIPLTAVRNMNNVALLAHNINEMAEGSPLLLNNIASKRMGRVEDDEEELFINGDGINREPRMLFQDVEGDEDIASIEDPSAAEDISTH